METHNDSIEAFNKFTKQLVNCRELKNGNLIVELLVSFKSDISELVENLEVRFLRTKANFGEISIAEGEKINSKVAVVNFNPLFDVYRFDGEVLEIRGLREGTGEFVVLI